MQCPCHSKRSYDSCCKMIHEGKLSESPVDLMRARYSAYALKLSDFIIDTTDPLNPSYEKNIAKWRKDIEHFCDITTFEDLKILDTEHDNDFGYVTFFAKLKQKENDISFTEKSYFHKKNHRWTYLRGKTSPEKALD